MAIYHTQKSSTSPPKPPPGLARSAPSNTFAPPPGLAPSPNAQPDLLNATKGFGNMMCRRSLPESLHNDESRRDCFEMAVFSCVEGLYRDRVTPTLGEVLSRLRRNETKWHPEEMNAVLPFCARDSQRYFLKPPVSGAPPQVLLRHPPAWFEGWVDAEGPDGAYSPSVMRELREAVSGLTLPCSLCGGIAGAASAIHQLKPKLSDGLLPRLTLGQLRQVVAIAVSPVGPLMYDPTNGRRLLARPNASSEQRFNDKARKTSTPIETSIMEAHQNTHIRVDADDTDNSPTPAVPATWDKAPSIVNSSTLTEALRQRPLPETVIQRGEEGVRRLQADLYRCVMTMHEEKVEPTIRAVRQRLRSQHSWTFEELQAIPLLAAREPRRYEIIEPSGGQPFKVLLREPLPESKKPQQQHLAQEDGHHEVAWPWQASPLQLAMMQQNHTALMWSIATAAAMAAAWPSAMMAQGTDSWQQSSRLQQSWPPQLPDMPELPYDNGRCYTTL